MKRLTSIRLGGIAALSTIALILGGMPAAAAASSGAISAAVVTQPTVQVGLGSPTLNTRSSRFTDVPIPSGITELTIEYGPGVASVDCYLTTGDPEDVIGWRHDPVVAERDVIDVVPGTVVAGGHYNLICRVPGCQDEWDLSAAAPNAANATVTASGSPYLTEVVERLSFGRVAFSASPDQRVAFTTATGTLPDAVVSGLMAYSSEGGAIGLDGHVTGDGGLAEFTMAGYEQFLYTEDPSHRSWFSNWSVGGPVAVSSGVTTTRLFSWNADITVTDAPSAVKIALSSSTAVSVQRVKAIIQVDAPLPESSPENDRRGTIVVKVDGVEVASSGMYASKNGRWTVSLPRLKKGLHVVTAEYSGWTWLAGSVSNRAALRIVV